MSDIELLITTSNMTNTEMSNKDARRLAGRPRKWLYPASSQFVLISVGMFSIWWGVSTSPVFWRDARLDHVADNILNGETFKRETLQGLLADADAAEKVWIRPEVLRSAAIIRLRLVEQGTSIKRDKPSGPVIDQLAASIRRSLSAAPADPFLWLALFWAQTMKDNWGKQDFANLRMSYFVGPHEGWVAVQRNYVAVSHFSELPPDLADAAVTEFKDLVASGYYEPAIKTLAGPGWPIRDVLLHRLEDAPEEVRNLFARTADRLGYDIDVPGVTRPEPRPWR